MTQTILVIKNKPRKKKSTKGGAFSTGMANKIIGDLMRNGGINRILPQPTYMGAGFKLAGRGLPRY